MPAGLCVTTSTVAGKSEGKCLMILQMPSMLPADPPMAIMSG